VRTKYWACAAIAAFLTGAGLSATANAEVDYPFDSNLVGQWKFNEGAGTVATDSVDGNDGNISGGAVYTSAADAAPIPLNPHALSFDGVDDFVTVPHDNALDVTSPYTLSAWVYVDSAIGYRPILFRGTTNTNDIEVYVQAASDDLIVAHNRDNGGAFDFVGFEDPPNGTWFHLAVTYDGTDMVAYYDGVAAAVTQNTTAMAAPDDTNEDWWIGKVDHTDFGGINLLTGRLDDVRIYDVALTAEQVQTLFNGGVEGEELYLADTVGADDDKSALYLVGLLSGPGTAVLTSIPVDPTTCQGGLIAPETNEVAWNNVDVLATTPDGQQLAFIDDSSGNPSTREVVSLDLTNGECTNHGQLNWLTAFGGNCSDGAGGGVGPTGTCNTDQGAFSPSGTMYIGRNEDDTIHTLDVSAASATLIGELVDQDTCNAVNLQGADLTFDADGNMWVWENANDALYRVASADLVAAPCKFSNAVLGVVNAEFIGTNGSVDPFTGLATRFNGLGNVVGSGRDTDDVSELDTTSLLDASSVANYAMMVDSTDFDHGNGDMSNGQLALCGVRSKGYYKTHNHGPADDNLNGVNVELCSVPLSDTTWDAILNDAKGKDLSMLTAQLIAALLNCDFVNDGSYDGSCDSSGFPLISTAETALCDALTTGSQMGPVVNDPGSGWWLTKFEDKDEKSTLNDIADQLDAFNNQGHVGFCALLANGEEDGDGPPPH